MHKAVSVVIPSLNGRKLLEKFLPDCIAVIQQETDAWEVLVVDNGSDDRTVEYLRKQYADLPVQVIALPTNQGFGDGCNQGIAQAQYPFVFLLNNDVRLVSGSLAPLFDLFADSAVFAAYPWQKVVHGSKASVYGGSTLKFHYGMFRLGEQFGGDFSEQTKPRFSWYASGAAALFSTEKLRQLAGFNPIYLPAYYEDTDLSQRAWQRGWKIYSVPTPPVEHVHESTTSRGPQLSIRIIKQRNLFLFQWFNLHDSGFWWRHLLWLPVNVLKETVRVPATLLGFLWAVTMAFRAWWLRHEQLVQISDAEIIRRLTNGQ